MIRIYQPALLYALRHKGLVAAVVLAAAVATVPVYRRLGTEFVPPLDEGVLLYMPSTISAISITEAKRLLQLTDSRLKSLPEVAHVLGKAGRADTSTDVAPLSMLETVVVLKPREQWPRRMSQQELIAKFDAAMKFPGSRTLDHAGPRKNRHARHRHAQSLGLKIAGPDIERFRISGPAWRNCCGTSAARARSLPNESTTAAIRHRLGSRRLARAGLSMEEAQTAVQNAIGGDNVTTVIQGRARYPVMCACPGTRGIISMRCARCW